MSLSQSRTNFVPIFSKEFTDAKFSKRTARYEEESLRDRASREEERAQRRSENEKFSMPEWR
jgi:hypothetical protein